MKILQANSRQDSERWEQFVDNHRDATNYHRWGWRKVIESAFHWPAFYLMAETEGDVAGILPLVWQKSWLFGSFLTSLPFLNSGGIVAESCEVEQALVGEATALAQKLGVEHIELRHRRNHELGLPVKTSKVAVVLDVEPVEEVMWWTLRKETRNLIRKAQKYGLTAEIVGEEGLGDFYGIFARNMRDLGTPVYAKAFFGQILGVFPDGTNICIVRHKTQPVAAGFLTCFRDTVEVAWASSLRKYLPMAPNMLLYWTMLRFAAQKGYRVFDFGRSTAGSGPHRFKLQWSSQEVPLHWYYWLPEGKQLPELNPHNQKFRLAIWTWRHLPLMAANALGPGIVRCLP
jgi:FemAB-related protein (PEP-CTERM system-associated)